MTTIALFPSVLGVRQGVLDAAERLRGDGHEVPVADVYDGRTFDDYPLPAEYDPVATETLWRRVLPFVRSCG